MDGKSQDGAPNPSDFDVIRDLIAAVDDFTEDQRAALLTLLTAIEAVSRDRAPSDGGTAEG